MKFEDQIRQRFVDAATLRYTVCLEFDGIVRRVDSVPEDVARDWLWLNVRRGTTQSSRVIIREVTPSLEVDAQPIEYVLQMQGLDPTKGR